MKNQNSNNGNMQNCGSKSKNGNMTDCGCGSLKERDCKSSGKNVDSAKMANKDSGSGMPSSSCGMNGCGCNSYNNENACE